jgi:hypothetical protein
MKSKAKIQSCKSRTVLVMSDSPTGGGCPRLVLPGNRGAMLRDDYHGRLSASRRLLSRLCSL